MPDPQYTKANKRNMNARSSIRNSPFELPTNQIVLEMSQNGSRVRFKQINVQS